MNKIILASAITAIAATAGFAQTSHLADNYVAQRNVYDSSISATVPGVVVQAGGQRTLYQVGSAEGLTRSVVFDDTGKKAEAWAQQYLGVTVKAQLCPAGADEDGTGGAATFGSC